MLDRALGNSELKHLNIDLSWDEMAKYVTASPEAVAATAALMRNIRIASCSDQMLWHPRVSMHLWPSTTCMSLCERL